MLNTELKENLWLLYLIFISNLIKIDQQNIFDKHTQIQMVNLL